MMSKYSVQLQTKPSGDGSRSETNDSSFVVATCGGVATFLLFFAPYPKVRPSHIFSVDFSVVWVGILAELYDKLMKKS